MCIRDSLFDFGCQCAGQYGHQKQDAECDRVASQGEVQCKIGEGEEEVNPNDTAERCHNPDV